MSEQGISLATTAAELFELEAQLVQHQQAAAAETARLASEIAARKTALNRAEGGLDLDKIAVAETILRVTDYSRGGEDRNSARSDAIRQFSTGRPVRPHYGDLWRVRFATKNYDRWSGQRSDSEYGMGPRHGSLCFEIGLTAEARRREQSDLSSAETEACVYYLVNLERIQSAALKAVA